jgi:hypothetical protein
VQFVFNRSKQRTDDEPIDTPDQANSVGQQERCPGKLIMREPWVRYFSVRPGICYVGLMHYVSVVGDFGFVAYRRVPGDYGKWNQRATDCVTTVSAPSRI